MSIPRDNFGRSGPQGLLFANLVAVPMNQFVIFWDWLQDTWAVVRIPGSEMAVRFFSLISIYTLNVLLSLRWT